MKIGISKTTVIQLDENETKTLATALRKCYGTTYYERYLDGEEQDIIIQLADALAVRC